MSWPGRGEGLGTIHIGKFLIFSCQPWLRDIYCGVGWDLAPIHGRIGMKNAGGDGQPREEEEEELEFDPEYLDLEFRCVP